MIVDAKFLYGLASVVVTVACAIPYIRGVYAGKTTPHVFSWLLWSLTSWICAAAQFVDDAGPGAWAMTAAAILCTYILYLAFGRGTRNASRADKMMLAAGLSALPVWFLTDNPLWSVVIISLVDVTAYGPTFRKSWGRPHEEVAIMYLLAAAWQGLSLMAMENYTAVTMLSPASLLVMNVSLVVYLLWRRGETRSVG